MLFKYEYIEMMMHQVAVSQPRRECFILMWFFNEVSEPYNF